MKKDIQKILNPQRWLESQPLYSEAWDISRKAFIMLCVGCSVVMKANPESDHYGKCHSCHNDSFGY
jgi:hypothetical protein